MLVEEKITLHGLTVHQRKAAFGNINPGQATEIFIRSALVEENLFPEPAAVQRGPRDAAKPTSRSLVESVALRSQWCRRTMLSSSITAGFVRK